MASRYKWPFHDCAISFVTLVPSANTRISRVNVSPSVKRPFNPKQGPCENQYYSNINMFPTPTGESSSHSGNCHCGAVRFSFTLSPPLHEYPTNTCNCSICTKNGYLLVYPFTKNLTIEKGKDMLKDYRFARRMASHQFCRECGSSCFILPPQEGLEGIPPVTAVNVSRMANLMLELLIILY